ncbi:MAG: pyruvate kinase [Candidatus Micrarchaeia archaeon]
MIDELHQVVRKTKVIATIGPSIDSFEKLEELAKAGLNAVRFNLSHEKSSVHEKRMKRVNELNESLDRKIAIVLDTQGPEIRTGLVKGGGTLFLKEGSEVVLSTSKKESFGDVIAVSYKSLPKLVSKGDKVLIADAKFELEVVESKGGNEVLCKVLVGGELSSRKNMGVPGMELDLPSITEGDAEVISLGAKHGADYVAQSFVRTAEDVLELMEMVQDAGSDAAVIAKIEHCTAMKNLESIIGASDATMVARGDLGVHLPIEDVPGAQKTIIQKSNLMGKPVVVATHMLESMVSNPRPTRAEATDVANAVFDGADAVMLSGETAVGQYPLKAVQTMGLIAKKAESLLKFKGLTQEVVPRSFSLSTAIDRAATQLAFDLDAAAIITPTSKGFTAKTVSKNRPKAEVIALTPNVRVQRKLAIVWGVEAIRFSESVNSKNMMVEAVNEAKAHGLVKKGDTVVVTAGIPLGVSGSTNTLRVQVVD